VNRDGSVFSLRRLGRASLVLLAAVLPFELVKPVAPVGPLQLSSVEVFLYASVGLWLAAQLANTPAPRGAGVLARMRPLLSRAGWRGLPEAQRAVVCWSAVLLLSAALAPLARGAAIKFALRSLGGVALFVAAADLLDSRRAVWRTLVGVAAGATISAMLMTLEVGVTGFASLLRPFHGSTFGVLGLARASGPFQYPNIAAMYLEAAVPAALAAAVAAAERGHPPRSTRMLSASMLAALLMLYALVLAASRAALVAELVVLIGMGVLAARLPLLSLLAITVNAQAASPMLALRLRFWEARSWYGSAIESAPELGQAIPSQMAPGATLSVGLSIRNLGAIVWPHDGKKPVKVSYHWTSEDGSTVYVLDGARTDLPNDVPPDQKIDIAATLRAPDRPGRYLLWWDLVHEGVTWFSDAGDAGRRLRVAVGMTASRKTSAYAGAWTVSTHNAFDQLSRKDLWRAGLLAFWDHPLLGLGPDNFRHAYGGYLGRWETDERLHANNFYIEILSTLGLLGLLALATLIATLARTARRAAAWPPARVLTFGIGAALAAYLVHGTLDYFLEFTPTYALLWLLAGALVALERIAARERASNRGGAGKDQSVPA
jgi:hypothetical protein